MPSGGGERPGTDLSALRFPFGGSKVSAHRGIGDLKAESSGVGGGNDAVYRGAVDVFERDVELTNQDVAGCHDGEVGSDEEEYERGLFEDFVGAFDRLGLVDGRQEGRGGDSDAREGVSIDEERRFDA